MTKAVLRYTALGLGIVVLLLAGRAVYWEKGTAGEQLYQLHCANCHGDAGQGLRKLIPPLAQSDYMSAHWREMPCLMRNGMRGEISVNGVVYDFAMPPVTAIKEPEMVQLLNFLAAQWRTTPLPKTDYAQVQAALETCK
jgi:mono/diheme cytochrome c family protein